MSETKRRGRPTLDQADHTVPVSISLPSRQFDALSTQAIREGVSLPEIIRRKIRRADDREEDEE